MKVSFVFFPSPPTPYTILYPECLVRSLQNFVMLDSLGRQGVLESRDSLCWVNEAAQSCAVEALRISLPILNHHHCLSHP